MSRTDCTQVTCSTKMVSDQDDFYVSELLYQGAVARMGDRLYVGMACYMSMVGVRS